MDHRIPHRFAIAAALVVAVSVPAFARVAAVRVALGPLSITNAIADAPAGGPLPEGAPRQVGYARTVEQLQTAQGVRRQLQWARLPEGGAIAAVSVTSPGAAAVRAALRVGDLPPTATLRFSAPGDVAAREVPAEALLAALQRNRDAGESGAAARTYWSPVVAGDTIVIEVELPPGADPDEVAFTTPLVSHLTARPAGGDSPDAEAVFTTDGSSFACPGALVGGARDGSRYFLTRERCVSTQAAASTLQAFWKAGGAAAQSGVGASLLYASIDTDTAFLLLDAPPAQSGQLVRASPPGMDPALEQWLGSAVSKGAIVPAGTFSPP
jgi:lysyl endopeptidase